MFKEECRYCVVANENGVITKSYSDSFDEALEYAALKFKSTGNKVLIEDKYRINSSEITHI